MIGMAKRCKCKLKIKIKMINGPPMKSSKC